METMPPFFCPPHAKPWHYNHENKAALELWRKKPYSDDALGDDESQRHEFLTQRLRPIGVFCDHNDQSKF
jgi:hypothetical protein